MGTLQDTINGLDDAQAKINSKKTICKVLNDKIDTDLSLFESILSQITGAISTYTKAITTALSLGFASEDKFIKASADAVESFGKSFPKLGNSLFDGLDEIFEDCPFLKLDPILNSTMGKINKLVNQLTDDITDTIKGLADYLPEFNVTLGFDTLKKLLDSLHISDIVKRIHNYFQCVKTTCGLDIEARVKKFDKMLEDCHLDSNGNFNNRAFCIDVVGCTQQEYNRLSQAQSVFDELSDQVAQYSMDLIVNYSTNKAMSLFDFGEWKDIAEDKVLELMEDFF